MAKVELIKFILKRSKARQHLPTQIDKSPRKAPGDSKHGA
jgi:hypothetical protein